MTDQYQPLAPPSQQYQPQQYAPYPAYSAQPYENAGFVEASTRPNLIPKVSIAVWSVSLIMFIVMLAATGWLHGSVTIGSGSMTIDFGIFRYCNSGYGSSNCGSFCNSGDAAADVSKSDCSKVKAMRGLLILSLLLGVAAIALQIPSVLRKDKPTLRKISPFISALVVIFFIATLSLAPPLKDYATATLGGSFSYSYCLYFGVIATVAIFVNGIFEARYGFKRDY